MESNLSSSGPTTLKQGGESIVRLVQHQARIAPDALAVRAGNVHVTYKQLDARANQLARYFRSSGVLPGDVVGLSLDRSVDLPVAALALFKIGAAYLPLEPKAPARRLQRMLETARIKLLLTNPNAGPVTAPENCKVIDLESSAAAIGNCSPEPVEIDSAPAQLAYVIFTSGSTGAPKPVAIGHDSLLNLIEWHNKTFQVTAADRATHLASIGFDAAVWELWPYLVRGASVHFVDDKVRTDPDKLRDFIVDENITISFAPTPLAERMLKLSWPKESALRFLLTGADTLHQYPPANLPFSLVNNYGPTECTVVATSVVLTHNASGDRLPPIGRPIDGVEVYILDRDLQRVPAGTIGEIFIGGRGVALGYLNDPVLTAERFVSNPFSSAKDVKLYRTGDMGRSLPDGQIAFHGRADEQVKINGFRVELNEVATALRRHPAIRDGAVSARENEAGEKQIVAYLVSFGASPSLGELRDFLSKELPEYMLPAMFVTLETLPVSSSGKVDRKALPAPTHDNILRDEVFQSPSSATEERVGTIVASLLKLEHLGVNDNFFYLGGNSLFGTQLIARLRTAFQVEVPLLKLFDHPTVAELAQEVERMMVAKLEHMSEEEVQRLLSADSASASL